MRAVVRSKGGLFLFVALRETVSNGVQVKLVFFPGATASFCFFGFFEAVSGDPVHIAGSTPPVH